MSRAGTLHLREPENIPDKLPYQTPAGTMWTEPINITVVSDEVHLSDTYGISGSEICHLLNSQARSIVASLYKAAQLLSQATISSANLIRSSSFTQYWPQEQDLWIEMPPRSVRDVVINVQRMGRGKPIDFFDEIPEESL